MTGTNFSEVFGWGAVAFVAVFFAVSASAVSNFNDYGKPERQPANNVVAAAKANSVTLPVASDTSLNEMNIRTGSVEALQPKTIVRKRPRTATEAIRTRFGIHLATGTSLPAIKKFYKTVSQEHPTVFLRLDPYVDLVKVDGRTDAKLIAGPLTNRRRAVRACERMNRYVDSYCKVVAFEDKFIEVF